MEYLLCGTAALLARRATHSTVMAAAQAACYVQSLTCNRRAHLPSLMLEDDSSLNTAQVQVQLVCAAFYDMGTSGKARSKWKANKLTNNRETASHQENNLFYKTLSLINNAVNKKNKNVFNTTIC